MFLHVAKIETSVVQGLSLYKNAKHWQQCVIHAFGLLFITTPEPSEYLLPSLFHLASSDIPGALTHSQEEVYFYWGSLQNGHLYSYENGGRGVMKPRSNGQKNPISA